MKFLPVGLEGGPRLTGGCLLGSGTLTSTFVGPLTVGRGAPGSRALLLTGTRSDERALKAGGKKAG